VLGFEEEEKLTEKAKKTKLLEETIRDDANSSSERGPPSKNR